ncbi:hypothetical protein TTHERM_00474990 (macronuclear) [Tetrahymena thermophila SB210]|uniref:Uncharacterized protein n=1 Tax=Tetrahymena thermophila (strain SB210) TaxID=312017 RepID=I7MHY0_TETTS|nr:hypothetical protein TTHERM_00474990 [Tetrahymena thermophila SB210]EAS03736.1 hypothetical protein TTHERM_00474990 [Tetrahymena thermophila SB210]|eukprot:XP_001023981.1 hypothetical protein TTHERM_00474990 [Tetrahymena thermophila SB210]
MNNIYQYFQKVQDANIYQKSHGLSILSIIICDKLEEMNMLYQENLNQLISNNFLQYVINEIKQKWNTCITDVNNLKRFLSFLYFQNKKDPFEQNLLELLNSQMIQNFLEGKIAFQVQEMSIDQNQNINDLEIKNYDQDKQLKINNSQEHQQYEDSEIDKEKYFELLDEEKKQIPNPISEVSQILLKYSYLKVDEDCKPFQSNFNSQMQYQYQYKCIGMEIQPFISKPLDTKQQAKTQAARLLYPHIKFFDRYREPYQRYSYSEKEKQEEQMCEDEFYQKQLDDFFIYQQIQDEGINTVSDVQEILQKQANPSVLYYVKEDFSRQDNGNTLCTAIFMDPVKKLTSQGFGLGQKMAKEIAYFKLLKDIKKYFYELNGSYYHEFNERPKKSYKRRNRDDSDNNDNNDQ